MINRKPLPASPAPLIMALEPRILLDGAAVVEAADVMTDNDFAADSSIDVYAVAPDQTLTTRREVVFVDASLPDVETLIDGLDDNAEVYLIEAYEDGLAQMIALLEGSENLDAIHILGHGDVAQANIGSTILSDGTLDANTNLLKQIGSFLSDDGDILLYGCNIAQGAKGEAFIDRIAQITQADIAASDDLTGDEAQGGNWELESTTGTVEQSIKRIIDYKNTLDVTTGTVFTENQISSLQPVINGANFATEIPTGSYAGGDLSFSLTGASIAYESIEFQTNLADAANITFDTTNRLIFDSGNFIGTYYQVDARNIDIELQKSYFNGDFSKSSEGWTYTSLNTGSFLSGSLASTVSFGSGKALVSGSGIFNTSNDSKLVTQVRSTGYIPLSVNDQISFDYRSYLSSPNNFIINAYLKHSSNPALDITLQNNLEKAQDGTTSYSPNTTITSAGNYYLYIEIGVKDNDGNNSVNWNIEIDNIKITPSTAPVINDNTIKDIANSVHYKQNTLTNIEHLRGYESSSNLTKNLNISVTDGATTSPKNANFDAIFEVTPVNDNPYGTNNLINSTGIVKYSTPGYELPVFDNIKIYPFENAQRIIETVITIDGIKQPSDEYILISPVTNPISTDYRYIKLDATDANSNSSFMGIAFTVTNSPDPVNSTTGDDRYIATITFTNNLLSADAYSWKTNNISNNTNSGEFSTALTTFLNNLRFRNNAINTTDDLDRKITLNSVTDSGSEEDPLNPKNTSQLNYSTTIQRVPVLTVNKDANDNDLPVQFTEGSSPIAIAGQNLAIGNLATTVSIVSATATIEAGFTSLDELSFNSNDTRFIVEKGINADGENFLTLKSNPGNTAILLTSEWETALQAIEFTSSSDFPDENPSRIIRWEINDGLERYIPERTTINITGVDDPVSFSINSPIDQVAATGQSKIIDCAILFDDPDTSLVYSISVIPDNNGLSIDSNGQISGTPTTTGTYTITVTADDGISPISRTFDMKVFDDILASVPAKSVFIKPDGTEVSLQSLYNSSLQGNNVLYAETGTKIDLYDGTESVILNNGDWYNSFQLRISPVASPVDEKIIINQTEIPLVLGSSGNFQFNNQTINYSVATSDGKTAVTFSSQWNNTELNTLINALAYRNESGNPDQTFDRTFDIASVNTQDGIPNTAKVSGTDVQLVRVDDLIRINATSFSEGEPAVKAVEDIYLRHIPTDTLFSGFTVTLPENRVAEEVLSYISGSNDGVVKDARFDSNTGKLSVFFHHPESITNTEVAMNKVFFSSDYDYKSTEELNRKISWNLLGDNYNSESFLPVVGNLAILPVLGLNNDYIQTGLNYELETARTFSNFGNNLEYSATGLPDGVTINKSTGLISGIPLLENEYEITISIKRLTDGKTASDSYLLTVFSPAVSNSSSTSDKSSSNNYQPLETYESAKPVSQQLSGSNTSTSSVATGGYDSSGSANTTDANSTQTFSYFDSRLTAEDSGGNDLQSGETESNSTQTDAKADGEAEKGENAENTPATGATSTTALSEASLNTVENAAGTLSAVFDKGIPNRYAPTTDEIRPPMIDKVTVSVGADGQLVINTSTGNNRQSGDSGMTIVDVEQVDNSLNIRINDISLDNTTRYSASLPNGLPLPTWLTIDPDTGEIKGKMPPGTSVLDIRVQAIDQDGTIRMLEIQLSLPETPEPLSFNLNINDNSAEPGFSQQLASTAHIIEKYSENIIQALNTYKST